MRDSSLEGVERMKPKNRVITAKRTGVWIKGWKKGVNSIKKLGRGSERAKKNRGARQRSGSRQDYQMKCNKACFNTRQKIIYGLLRRAKGPSVLKKVVYSIFDRLLPQLKKGTAGRRSNRFKTTVFE